MTINRRFILLLFLFLDVCSTFSSVPAGYYYMARNKKKAELKTALKNYCSPLYTLQYGGGKGYTWEGFYYADNRNDTVIDMYSNTIRKFDGFSAVSGMDIEHSFPKSWWGGYENNAYHDLFHLYPADGVTNSTKNDLPLGEVSGTPTFDNGVSKIGKNGFETTYTGNCFEPADEYKGDFARSYFYIVTMYEDLAPLWQSPMLNNNTWPVWQPWAIDLLMKWSREDPVSEKERARIEHVYNIQGNRNPFIDYPDLAEYIWGADTTQVYPFPEESEPFLVTPRRGTSLDFGVIMQSDSKTQTLQLLGANLDNTVPLKIEHKNTVFSVSPASLTAEEVMTGTTINISFAPETSSEFRDTLTVSGAGLQDTLRIPVEAFATPDFITLEPTNIIPVGGDLNWISDPQATDYELTVYRNEQQAGDLIISGYVEGSSWNKAIEIYNGTGESVDLSGYTLQKQSNGDGNFGSNMHLSGILANGATYTIVHKDAAAELLAKANLVTDTLLQFNGNDAIRLVRKGVPIDIIGTANGGADYYWGLDVSLQRKAEVTHPTTEFDSSEWNNLAIDEFSFLGNHQMQFSANAEETILQTLTGKTTTYHITSLIPESKAIYNVKAIRPDGNISAVNSMEIKTTALDAPVIMEAENVESTAFTADWDEPLYASSYLLDVYKLTGTGQTTETEEFGTVGTSGTPLPSGWTGTASGNYTSTTSSGNAIPSVGLKSDGEWLQTKTYSQPVTQLSFMYRFASSATGSSLALYGNNSAGWNRIDSIPYVNTTKTVPVYQFSTATGYNAFRWIYHKVAGNMAIDDVTATYGVTDTIFVEKEKAVTGNSYVETQLTPATTYYYRVKAVLGSALSPWSETADVTTLQATALTNTYNPNLKLYGNNGQLYISGMQPSAIVSIYSITGNAVFQQRASVSTMTVSLAQHGIYIVQIKESNNNSVFKVLL